LVFAIAITGANLFKASAIDALVFLRLKVSLAEVNTAILSTFAASAASIPRSLGTSAE
jgi:hypothetical protein